MPAGHLEKRKQMDETLASLTLGTYLPSPTLSDTIAKST